MTSEVQTLSQKIGKRILTLREGRGYSTTGLAKEIGVSQAHVSRMENGRQGFRTAMLEKLSDIFDVHISYFFVDDLSNVPARRGNVRT